MKKSIFRQILAIVAALSLLSCAVVPTFAAESATTGYDTKYTHVYSPMDLMDVTQSSDTQQFSFVGDAYDSSIWKFASGTSSTFDATSDIPAPTLKVVKGGVKLSWDAVEGTATYTVKVSQVGGNYTAVYETDKTEFTLTTLELGNTYAFQIISALGASKVLTYNNILAGTSARSDFDGGAVVTEKDEGYSETFLVQIDDNAKKAFTGNGAVLIKMESIMYDELSSQYLDEANGITYGDAWLASNTLIWPSDENGKPIDGIAGSQYWANNGENHLIVYDENGEIKYDRNLDNRGIVEGKYKSSGIRNGYILIPLDDFDSEDFEYNLFDAVQKSGVLVLSNTGRNYYYQVGEDILSKSFGTGHDQLKTYVDRDLAFPEIYIVSDYNALVAGGITGEAENKTELLNTTAYVEPSNAAFLNNYISFTAEESAASYALYCSTNNYTKQATVYTNRAIKYTAASGEVMKFGFTAPETAMYEISAPITVESGTGVKYAVYKTDANGNRVCLQGEKEYTTAGKFCNLQVNLTAGETVWLEATGSAGAVINIGIPQAIKYSSNIAANETDTTYTYRVMDYFEDGDDNGKTYKSYATTANTTGAWDFGYFKYNGTFTGSAKTFTANSFAMPDTGKVYKTTDDNGVAVDTGSDLSPELLASFEKYELLRAGDYYNVWDITSESATATGTSIPGVMYANAAAKGVAETTAITTYFHLGTGAASETLDAYGNWFKFTAPVGGKAVFNSPTALANTVLMVVAKNNNIVFSSYVTADAASGINIGDIVAGDEITVLIYSVRSSKQNVAISDPYITVSGNYSTLTLDAQGGTGVAETQYVANGTAILPTPVKAGKNFLYWEDSNGVQYTADSTYTHSGDTTLTAVYDESTLIGDIDGDGSINAYDVVRLRRYLMGDLDNITADRMQYANVTEDTESIINALDVVRLKKNIVATA